MNDISIPVYNRGLEDVTRDIRIKTGQFLMDAIEIGRLLFEAKAMVEPRGWSKYIEEQLPFSHSWANNYMKLYKELGTEQLTLFGNSQALMNLRPTHALEILTLPAEEREAFLQEHDVENMSSRQLKQAIKDREEAEAARAEAEQRAAEAEHFAEKRNSEAEKAEREAKAQTVAADAARESEKKALEQVEKLNKDLEKAQAAEKKAKEDLKKLQDSPQVPDSIMEQLRKDAEAQAAETATAEIRKQLAAATAAADEAAKARAEAEARLAEAQKSAKLSNPDMMAVNVLGKKMLSDWNTILGHRKKAVAADESYDAPLRAFLEKMLETMRSGMEGV